MQNKLHHRPRLNLFGARTGLSTALSCLKNGCFLAAMLLLAGCDRDKITSYRVPKEKPVETQAAAPTPGAPSAEVHWVTPPGWQELPASGMRVGLFKISTNGANAEVSITPLPGVNGIEVDSVNMWRNSLGLPPVDAAGFAKSAEAVPIGNLEGKLVDLAGGTNKNRTIGAMAGQSGTLWFFKLTGEDHLVEQQKPMFQQFLKSITFPPVNESNAAVPNNRGPFSATGNLPPGAGAEAGNHPAWKVPQGWVEQQPASSMLLASYLAPGKTGGKAEVTVSMFQGEVGGELANVNRWRGQLGLSSISEADLPQTTSQIDVGDAKGVLVDLSGQNVRTGAPARMLGLIVPRGGNTWFYKMMGDTPAITDQKKAFLEFATIAH